MATFENVTTGILVAGSLRNDSPPGRRMLRTMKRAASVFSLALWLTTSTTVAYAQSSSATDSVTASGQDQEQADATALVHSVPAAPQRSYAPASVPALPGLQCKLYSKGSSPSASLTVFTDDDGYARFHAVRAVAGDEVQWLALDCTDSAGNLSAFSVDLTSDDTFAPRPVNLANERGTDRPALKGDPLSYSQSELIQTGYGLRPDPADTAAYSRWLAAASTPGRLLEAKRPSPYSHRVLVTTTAPAWTGSVLKGAPKYVSTEANFNVPTGIPSGDETSVTATAIWNGLGGLNGSGLIQGGVDVQTTPFAATYGSWREYCCGKGNSNGYGGAFIPNPGDEIYSAEWYCDSAGNPNINGGYGCTYLKDLTSGQILSCTSPSGSPCWSAKAHPLCSVSPTTPNCMTLGLSAEFVIENQTGQVAKGQTAFTDFTPQVTIAGSASTVKDPYGYTQTISTDPLVELLIDFTHSTSHMNVSLGKAPSTPNDTYFSVSQFTNVGGAADSGGVICGNKSTHICNAQSIAVGPNANGSKIGDPWVLGKKAIGDDYPVYHWEQSKWVQKTGAGTMIAVSPEGYPWVVNHLGNVYYWNGSEFKLAPGKGCATSIGVGPHVNGLNYGDPWIIGCDGGSYTSDGYASNASIYKLEVPEPDLVGPEWVKQPGTGSQIAVSPQGFAWVINAKGNIFYWDGVSFVQYPTGCASSIAVGPPSLADAGFPYGEPWITGCSEGNSGVFQGFPVYQLRFGSWVQIPGPASDQISVSPDLGVPWLVNYSGQIFE